VGERWTGQRSERASLEQEHDIVDGETVHPLPRMTSIHRCRIALQDHPHHRGIGSLSVTRSEGRALRLDLRCPVAVR
jgi:hypothetical protein